MVYTNNPVLISVPYTDHNETNKLVSFHMLVLDVEATCNGTAISHEFSSPCSNTGSDTVTFDIHTCLQAAAENYPWSASSTGEAPKVTYTCTAKEEYLIDGSSNSNAVNPTPASGEAVIGGLTDFERVTGKSSATSSKPCTLSSTDANYSVQVAASDEDVVIGGAVVTPTATDARIYRLSDSLADLPDRYLFRFVNRYGCMESISLECFRETEMNVTSSEYTLSRPDYLSSDIRRTRYTKQNDYETWKLSSGPLDRPWQQWYAHELLLAEYSWLYVNSTWQRVHIVPEETVTLVNRNDASILTVQFSVRFDLNGSPV